MIFSNAFLAFDARIRGVSVGILPSRLVLKKLEWSGYPTVKKTLMISLAVSTEYRRVTDGRTDVTSCHSIVRAMHTRHVVKIRR